MINLSVLYPTANKLSGSWREPQKPMDTKQHGPEIQLSWSTLFALAFVLKSTCKSQTRCTFTRDQIHICLTKILLSTNRYIIEKVLFPAYYVIMGRTTKSKKAQRRINKSAMTDEPPFIFIVQFQKQFVFGHISVWHIFATLRTQNDS